METHTIALLKKSLRAPDETRRFCHGKIDLVDLEETTLGLVTLQPGWKWSNDVRPLVKTESCQMSHIQYVLSGRLKIVMDDGKDLEIEPGDAVLIPPGHDAWVVGDEPFLAIDFAGLKNYAKRPEQ